MKSLIAAISALSAVSMFVFIGAFQACSDGTVDSASTEVLEVSKDAASYHEIQVVSGDVLAVVTTEELDIVMVDVIEFTEEETSDIFDTVE